MHINLFFEFNAQINVLNTQDHKSAQADSILNRIANLAKHRLLIIKPSR
jgi:hypothetical protein